jgi:hypothetical protein
MFVVLFIVVRLNTFAEMILTKLQLFSCEAVSSILCPLHNAQDNNCSSLIIPVVNLPYIFATMFAFDDNK